MTTFDRFDPFERRIGAAMDDIVGTRPLDYLDDIFRQTARSRQRPRWSFPERWFNVDTTFARPAFNRQLPVRMLIVLAVLMALAASAAFYFGTQPRVAPPFGPAANGQVVYPKDGDLFVRDTLTGEGRLLVGGDGDQFAATYSPDGTKLAYATGTPTGDAWFVASSDGTGPHVQIAKVPPTGNAQGAWAPDSKHLAMIFDVNNAPSLQIFDLAGVSTPIDLGGRKPWDVAWMAPAGERLVIRTENSVGRMDLVTLRPDGSDLRPFGLNRISSFGPTFTLSGPVVSPDGSTIAYNGIDLAADGAEHFRLHLVNADGTNDRAVPGPDDPLIQENWPTYSPDGKWIVVQRWMFKDGVAGAKGWIAILPADGSQVGRDIGPRFEGNTDTAIAKLWSPDGSRILMVVRSTNQVFSIDPVSGQYEELTWTTELPDWQRVAR